MSASDQRKSNLLFIALAKSGPRVRSATGKSSGVGECMVFTKTISHTNHSQDYISIWILDKFIPILIK